MKRCDHVSVVSMSFILLFSPRTFCLQGTPVCIQSDRKDYLRGLPRTARGQPMDIIHRMQSQGTFTEGSQGFPWDTGTFRTRETSLGGHGLSVEPDDRQLSYIFMLIMSLHGKVLPSYKRLLAAITPNIIPGTLMPLDLTYRMLLLFYLRYGLPTMVPSFSNAPAHRTTLWRRSYSGTSSKEL